MLGFNQTFDDTRSIKVLVIPIGENSLFDSHFHIVSRRKCVPMYDLNRPSDWKKGSFKYFDWGTGNLRFEYLRYDRVPHGPGSFDDYQSSKRVLMVMGLINYPELGVIGNKIQDELDYYSRRHPNIVLRRVFVFNYSFDQISVNPGNPGGSEDDIAQLMMNSESQGSVIIFPPEGVCEGGSMIDVHLQEVMGNAGVMIISSLESQMTTCDEGRLRNHIPSGLLLSSLYDEYETQTDSHHTSKLKQSVKKKPVGRIRKWMGDLSLQVCSPVDAIEHYAAAIHDCRTLGDYFWLAGALEGFTAAILSLLKLKIPVDDVIAKDLKSAKEASGSSTQGSESSRVLRLAEDRSMEALMIYSRHLIYCGLEVECTLRLARMFEEFAVVDRDQKVVEYVLRAASVPGLNSMQQIECILEGGIICKRLQLHRKYALLLYIASLMSAESEHLSMAHALMRKACVQYGIGVSPMREQATLCVKLHPRNVKDNNPMQVTSLLDFDSKINDLEVFDPAASWIGMRRTIFAHTAHVAKESGDSVSATRSISALLRLMSDLDKRNDRYQCYWSILSEGLGGVINSNSPALTNGGQMSLSEESIRGMQSPLQISTRLQSSASFSIANDLSSSASINSSLIGQRVLQGSIPKTVPTSSSSSSSSSLSYSVISSELRRGSSSVFSSPNVLGGITNSMNSLVVSGGSQGFSSRQTISSAADSLLASISPISLSQYDNNDDSRDRTGGGQLAADIRDGFRKITIPKISTRLMTSGKQGKDSVDHYNSNSASSNSNRTSVYLGALGTMDGGSKSGRTTPTAGQSNILTRGKSSSTALGGGSGGRGDSNQQKRKQSSGILSPVKRSFSKAKHTIQQSSVLSHIAREVIASSVTASSIIVSNSGSSFVSSPSIGGSSSGKGESTICDFKEVDLLASLSMTLESLNVPREQEEQAIAMLSMFTKEILPESVALLPATVVSIQPLIPLKGYHPSRLTSCPALTFANSVLKNRSSGGVSNNAEKKISALFYDPFKRVNANDSSKPVEVLWPVNSLCKLLVVLHNPLSVDLQFDHLCVLMSGVAHKVYPCSVSIPAHSVRFEVELFVKPYQVGELKVVGLKLFMNNAMQTISTDSKGNSIVKRTEISNPHGYPWKVTNVKKNFLKQRESDSHAAVHTDSMNDLVQISIETNTILVIPDTMNFHAFLKQIHPDDCCNPVNMTISPSANAGIGGNYITNQFQPIPRGGSKKSSLGSNVNGIAGKFLMTMDSSIAALYGIDPNNVSAALQNAPQMQSGKLNTGIVNPPMPPLQSISSMPASPHGSNPYTFVDAGQSTPISHLNFSRKPRQSLHLFHGEIRREIIVLKHSAWDNLCSTSCAGEYTQRSQNMICDMKIELHQWSKLQDRIPSISGKSNKSNTPSKSSFVLKPFSGPLSYIPDNSEISVSKISSDPVCTIKTIRCRKSIFNNIFQYNQSSSSANSNDLMTFVADKRSSYEVAECEGDLEIELELKYISGLEKIQIDIEIIPDDSAEKGCPLPLVAEVNGSQHQFFNNVKTLFEIVQGHLHGNASAVSAAGLSTPSLSLFSRKLSIDIDLKSSPALEIINEGNIFQPLQTSPRSQQKLYRSLQTMLAMGNKHISDLSTMVIRPIISNPIRLMKVANRSHYDIDMSMSDKLGSRTIAKVKPLGVASLMIVQGGSDYTGIDQSTIPHIRVPSLTQGFRGIQQTSVLQWEMKSPAKDGLTNVDNRHGDFFCSSIPVGIIPEPSLVDLVRRDIVEQTNCPVDVCIIVKGPHGIMHDISSISQVKARRFIECNFKISLSKRYLQTIGMTTTSKGDATAAALSSYCLPIEMAVIVVEQNADKESETSQATTQSSADLKISLGSDSKYVPSNVAVNGSLHSSFDLILPLNFLEGDSDNEQVTSIHHKVSLCFLQPGTFEVFPCISVGDVLAQDNGKDVSLPIHKSENPVLKIAAVEGASIKFNSHGKSDADTNNRSSFSDLGNNSMWWTNAIPHSVIVTSLQEF